MDKVSNFVFKELKSYCHNELLAGSTKRYRRVFESQNTDYISAEGRPKKQFGFVLDTK